MLRLSATQYRQTFTSGHSCPCLIEAESLEGDRYEVVLKMRESVHGGNLGLARELVASSLASALGLCTPPPFLVEVTPEFAASLATAEEHARFERNVGWHYGSEFLGPGWNAVPFTADLPLKLIEVAASVFEFDALIRNDDRHVDKSNYLIKGATVAVIDHERAFPSAREFLRPWEPEGLGFLKKHVFYHGLRGQLPDFEPLESAVEKITPSELASWIGTIPEQWDVSGISNELQGYLMALRENFRNVMVQTKILLR